MIVDVGGPISYTDHGGPPDAPILVLVHGIGACQSNWDEVAPRLTGHARVYALDLPGFGRSPSAGRRTTVAANADVLGRVIGLLLAEHNERDLVLVGTSMGAIISILLAAAQPHLVRGLVLIAPPWPPARHVRINRDVARSAILGGMPGLGELLVARRLARIPAELRVEHAFTRASHNPTNINDILRQGAIANENLVTDGGLRRVHDYLSAARSIVRTMARGKAYWARVERLQKPTLLLHGVHDRLVPVAQARMAVHRLRLGTYRELDAGHVAHMEVPHEVAATIVSWLATVGGNARH
ncbi:alpha/beta fold hydrolase [Hamadaea tsunoensis]|uniref:alpha/beta fold hydrolase n=1 Tax=Hamadaea tsunoensis TaxID=53368 RepID=UPI0004183050|nr:alpha/beta hydrolase [Hamadaea tsunoensis]